MNPFHSGRRGTRLRTRDGKTYGIVEGQSLYKSGYESRHFLRKPRLSIAIDEEILRYAEAQGARSVIWHEYERKKDYEAQIRDIRQHGFVIDRGYGRQIALPLEAWAVVGHNTGR